jgi:transcription elongation factor GreA
MQTPYRKSDKIPRNKLDAKITDQKFQELTKTLDYLKNQIRPKLITEVKELSTTGDYSENAGYQSAKFKLRQTNSKIDKIEDILKRSDIITINGNNDKVEIGCTVEIEVDDKIKKYQILGSLETDPLNGLISYNSPLGSLLLNKKIGDVAETKINGKIKKYKIKNIF